MRFKSEDLNSRAFPVDLLAIEITSYKPDPIDVLISIGSASLVSFV